MRHFHFHYVCSSLDLETWTRELRVTGPNKWMEFLWCAWLVNVHTPWFNGRNLQRAQLKYLWGAKGFHRGQHWPLYFFSKVYVVNFTKIMYTADTVGNIIVIPKDNRRFLWFTIRSFPPHVKEKQSVDGWRKKQWHPWLPSIIQT